MNKTYNLERLGASLIMIIMVFIFSGAMKASAADYYFSSTTGNNSNGGESASQPKASFANTSFASGDRIYLKSGDVWKEELTLLGLNNIKICVYGGEENAIIDRQCDVNCAGMVLTNCSGVEITGITIKNAGAGIVLEYTGSEAYTDINISDCSFYSIQGRSKFDPASPTAARGNYRRSAGIELIGTMTGTVSDINVSNCAADMGDALLLVNVNDAENTHNKDVKNLTVKNSSVRRSLTHGFHISGVDTGKLVNCTVSDGRPMDYPHGITGIFLAATNGFTVDGCEVSYVRTYHDNPDGTGIDLEGNNLNAVVKNCNIHHCDGVALSAYYGNDGCEISSNKFYMNDMDRRSSSCITIGDVSNPSRNFTITGNKWCQLQRDGFSFIQSQNPSGEYSISETNNEQIALEEGVVFSEDYNYYPLGGKLTPGLQKNQECAITEITGNKIDRNFSVKSVSAGYEYSIDLPTLSSMTAQMRLCPVSGRLNLKIGNAEAVFENGVVSMSNNTYPLTDDWTDIVLSIDSQTGKYGLKLGSSNYSGTISGFSGTNSIRFVAESDDASFCLDDVKIYNGIYFPEFSQKPVLSQMSASDVINNGRITSFLRGREEKRAMVVRKVIKSGVTTARRQLSYGNTSFMLGLDVSFYDDVNKEIAIENSGSDVLVLSVEDNEMTVSAGGSEHKIADIRDGEVCKIRLYYDKDASLWTVWLNDDYREISGTGGADAVRFSLLDGGTGMMRISNIYGHELTEFQLVKLADDATDLSAVGARFSSSNYKGDAYIENKCFRVYCERTNSGASPNGELNIPISQNLSGKVRVSFDIMLENYRTTSRFMIYGHDEGGTERWVTAARFAFNEYGRVQYMRSNKDTGNPEYANASAEGSTSAARFTYNRFMNVVLDIDTSSDTVNMYLDGVSVVRNVALINNIEDISRIGFIYGTNQNQSMCIKNLSFESMGNGFIETLADTNSFEITNDGGVVTAETVETGDEESMMFEKYSACGNVFRSTAFARNNYKAVSISGEFVFDETDKKKTAIDITDSDGESILEISAENGKLIANGGEITALADGVETDIVLVIYDDNSYYMFVDGIEQLNGVLDSTPSYWRSGIGYNSKGNFELRDAQTMYYFEDCVRIASDHSNNVSGDTLFGYSNIHYLGNDATNNVNIDIIR